MRRRIGRTGADVNISSKSNDWASAHLEGQDGVTIHSKDAEPFTFNACLKKSVR